MERLASSSLLARMIPQEDADALYRIYPDLPRTHLVGCPSCGKNRGYGVDGILELDGEQVICNCHDQLQRHKHYLNAGMGMAYQVLSWNDFRGDPVAKKKVAEWAGNADANVESGRGLYIWSETNGTGKTMLAALALKECISRGITSYMTTFQDLLSSLKSGWKDAEFDRWYRGRIDSAQVLVLDDIGKESESGFNGEFAKQTLDSLLRTRTQQGRPTIFTTNMSPSKLSAYGMGVVSLVTEDTEIVFVEGNDFRPYVHRLGKGFRRIY